MTGAGAGPAEGVVEPKAAESSRFAEQRQKMKTHPGFVAALDQSGGSTPHALRDYGIEDSAWSSPEEMFAIVHRMRTRIITSPSFIYAGKPTL